MGRSIPVTSVAPPEAVKCPHCGKAQPPDSHGEADFWTWICTTCGGKFRVVLSPEEIQQEKEE